METGRWCDQHGRYECTKNSKRGGPCHQVRLPGLNACKNHSGRAYQVSKEIGQAQITAWSTGGQPDINYTEVVLSVLQMTYLRLEVLSRMLREQAIELDEGSQPTEGLIGYRYGAGGKDGKIYVVSEELRGLVQLEAAERDRAVKYAKTAHDMGIDERMTSLAEKWADDVGDALSKIFDGLDLSPDQEKKVPGLVERHLKVIEGGSAS